MDASPQSPCIRTAAAPRVLWVGPAAQADLRLARDQVGRLATVLAAESPAAAVTSPPEPFADRSPAVILLAADAPGRWSADDVLALAIRWPLAPIVSVAASLVDGRRRSGPPLAGIEDVPWHDVPGRLAVWLDDRAVGRPGTLGMPATVRREDRILEASALLRDRGQRPPVAAAAATGADLDGLVDLLRAAGETVGRQTTGKPALDEPSWALVWDAGRIDADRLAWLRMLSANRPALRIVMLDSFPRAEVTLAATHAGAAAVLGRPASVEALAGTLGLLAAATGLSPPPETR